jgi:hypothetical protein
MENLHGKRIQMNEQQFDDEFNVDVLTQSIVDKAKAEVKARYGNKKRHRQ